MRHTHLPLVLETSQIRDKPDPIRSRNQTHPAGRPGRGGPVKGAVHELELEDPPSQPSSGEQANSLPPAGFQGNKFPVGEPSL